MMNNTILTDNAPKPVGAYSQGVHKKGLLFTSGQLPIEPSSGVLVSGDINKEVQTALSNVKAVIEAGGGTLGNIMKMTVFITDMSLFSTIDSVYCEFLGENRPARSVIEVKALPKGARVEIEAVAVI